MITASLVLLAFGLGAYVGHRYGSAAVADLEAEAQKLRAEAYDLRSKIAGRFNRPPPAAK